MAAGWKIRVETSAASAEDWYVAIADAVEATTTVSRIARASARLIEELSEGQIAQLGLTPGQIKRA
jgi:hypothetical protein